MNRLLIASLAVLMLNSLTSWPAKAEADWPMFKYNAARIGRVEQRPAIKVPTLLWKMPIGVTGWLNSPVIADNTVFIGSSGYLWNLPDYAKFHASKLTDGVYAFDLNSGQRKWYAPAQSDVTNVVWVDHKLIATGNEGAVWALNPDTGKQLWRTPLQGAGFSLLPLGNTVIVGDAKGQLSWVETLTGHISQKAQLDGQIRAGATSDGQTVFAATIQGTVYAFDREGNLQWRQSLRELDPEALEIYGAPVLYKDSLIVGYSRNTYYASPAMLALEIQTGKLHWQAVAYATKTAWGNLRSSPALYNNLLIYAEPYSNTVVALDADTGKAAGGIDLGAPMFPQWSSPVIAGTTAYVPRFDGGLYALNAANGNALWQLYLGIPSKVGMDLPAALKKLSKPEWKPPVGDAIYASPALAADGRILIPAAGYLYCIGEKK